MVEVKLFDVVVLEFGRGEHAGCGGVGYGGSSGFGMW